MTTQNPVDNIVVTPEQGSEVMSLVVCSLESWGEVKRRIRILVDELVELDPSLQVLFVAPALDILHELKSGRVADIAGPRLTRSTPGSMCCGPASGCRDWSARSPTARWPDRSSTPSPSSASTAPALGQRRLVRRVRRPHRLAQPLRHHRRLAAGPAGPPAAGPADGGRAAAAGAQRGGRGLLAGAGPHPGRAPARSSSSPTGSTSNSSAPRGPGPRTSPRRRSPSTWGPCTPGGSTSRSSSSWPGAARTSRSSWSGPNSLPSGRHRPAGTGPEHPPARGPSLRPDPRLPAARRRGDHPPPGRPVHREPRPDQGLRVPGRRPAHRVHPGGRLPRAGPSDRHGRPEPVRRCHFVGLATAGPPGPRRPRAHPSPPGTPGRSHGLVDGSGREEGESGDRTVHPGIGRPAPGRGPARRSARARVQPLAVGTPYPRRKAHGSTKARFP